jgi:GT2 family glycosyltransferase
MIAFNNRDLTERAVQSVFAQDIPVDLHFVDNGSTDDTWAWAATQPFASLIRYSENRSPLTIANAMVALLFESNRDYVLGVPNDVRLPSNCYSELLKWPRGFVCATDNGLCGEPEVRPARAVSENTPMAVMLTRRWAWQALIDKDGYFLDEKMFHYASDCDMALRMAACGIRGVQLDIPFWHYGSASLRLSPNRRAMEIQADADRAYFERKWGFRCDSLEYGQRPADLNFTGKPA